MSELQTLVDWMAASPLTSATVLFGSAIIVVTLHALLSDYAVMRRR